MYLDYYNLREKPFAIEPNPRFIYLGEDHREALATMIYAVEQREGWALLLGPPGTGKTTLIIALLRHLREKVVAGVITNPRLDTLDFFNMVGLEMGMEGPFSSKGRFLVAFSHLIKRCRAEGKTLLLVVDEAQSLQPGMLDELRLLGNLDDASPRVLNIFLVGQPEMAGVLRQAKSTGLLQRIRRYYLLRPLGLETIRGYVRHRMSVAGGDDSIFEDEAIKAVYKLSGGNCRVVNAICDDALLQGYASGQRVIGAELLKKAVSGDPALSYKVGQDAGSGEQRLGPEDMEEEPAPAGQAEAGYQVDDEEVYDDEPYGEYQDEYGPYEDQYEDDYEYEDDYDDHADHRYQQAYGRPMPPVPDQVMDMLPSQDEMEAANSRGRFGRRDDYGYDEPPQRRSFRAHRRREPAGPGLGSRFATSLSRRTPGSFGRRLLFVIILLLIIGGLYFFFSNGGSRLVKRVWQKVTGAPPVELASLDEPKPLVTVGRKGNAQPAGVKDWGPIIYAPKP